MSDSNVIQLPTVWMLSWHDPRSGYWRTALRRMLGRFEMDTRFPLDEATWAYTVDIYASELAQRPSIRPIERANLIEGIKELGQAYWALKDRPGIRITEAT